MKMVGLHSLPSPESLYICLNMYGFVCSYKRSRIWKPSLQFTHATNFKGKNLHLESKFFSLKEVAIELLGTTIIHFKLTLL